MTGIPYGGAGYGDEATGHFPVGQNVYNDGYGLHQVNMSFLCWLV